MKKIICTIRKNLNFKDGYLRGFGIGNKNNTTSNANGQIDPQKKKCYMIQDSATPKNQGDQTHIFHTFDCI